MMSRRALAVFSAGVALLGSLDACGPPRSATSSSAPGAERPRQAETTPLTPSEEEGFVGVLVAAESVDVPARQAGQLAQIMVQMGDAVAAGAVLARLEGAKQHSDLLAAAALLEQAEAQLLRTEAEWSQAQDRVVRMKDLMGGRLPAVSGDELGRARYQERITAAQRQAAAAAVRERRALHASAQLAIDDLVLRAPCAGVVSSRYADPGSMAEPGRVVVRMVCQGRPRLRFAIPEDQAPPVLGAPLVAHTQGLGSWMRGHVVRVAPEVDAAARMLLIEAALDENASLGAVGRAAQVFFRER